MFGDGALTFREFAMGETLPLATIHAAVLELLRGRDDAVLFGAQAVNAYVDEPRMSQDVDILSTRAAELAEEVRASLHERFHIAVRTRVVKGGLGYRVYQVQEPKNRHLVDVRSVAELPPHRRVAGVMVVEPAELAAQKVLALAARQHSAKSDTDRADLRRLLMAFPDLKSSSGAVSDRLHAAGAGERALTTWHGLVVQETIPEDEDQGF